MANERPRIVALASFFLTPAARTLRARKKVSHLLEPVEPSHGSSETPLLCAISSDRKVKFHKEEAIGLVCEHTSYMTLTYLDRIISI